VARVDPRRADVPRRLAVAGRRLLLDFIPGWIWLGIKTFFVVSLFIWVRGTFPRFRYDQIMRLGWKIFIPVTLVWLLVVGGWMQTPGTSGNKRRNTRCPAVAASSFSVKDFLKSFMLAELFKGMA
jgi:hypothetical protein